MSQKAIQLSERFFQASLEKDAAFYRETGNVISLLNTVLEALAESIPNIGVSIAVKHDLECYFFINGKQKETLEIKQKRSDNEMIPISFELKDRENRFYISDEKLVLEVTSGIWLRKIYYEAKTPGQLVIRDFQMDGKKEEKKEEIISQFDESGIEQQRIHEIYRGQGKGIIARFQERKKPIATLREWYREPERQSEVVVTVCDIYKYGKKRRVDHVMSGTYFISGDDIYLLNHDGLGYHQMVDLEKYLDFSNYWMEEEQPHHKR